MAESFRFGWVLETVGINTIADGMAARIPVPDALRDLQGTVADVVLVDGASGGVVVARGATVGRLTIRM